MLYVPVVGSTGNPLMPCHPARARELVRAGRALRRFNRGMFYIRLMDRQDGVVQSVAVGVDPGSKKEGFTVKSAVHTYLNMQTDAVTWVKEAVKTRREMRRARRFRKTPCRQRNNRLDSSIQLPPSTKARWQWKLRIVNWLRKLYPVACVVVEDIKAVTRKGRGCWNRAFSLLEVGKRWFYRQIEAIAHLETKQGYETKELRDKLGLKKASNKMSERFEAHCVDSWVLANSWTGGHIQPDNTRLLLITPLRFHRRQLHRLQPEKGGIRKPYGGTHSLGFKRGSLVKHGKYGLAYVGGYLKGRISLHSLTDGRRLCQKARPVDCRLLTFNSWRWRYSPA